ncbi:MAG TPA: HEAT repeat domain-containing protein [Candidatus Acidoferrales bacterium]|nr:HEAT repeat domain-containing protein [Candidatus Acidoferrales bacterium]
MPTLRFAARFISTVFVLCVCAVTGGAGQHGATEPQPPSLRDQAWSKLKDSAQDKDVKHRANALKAMGILRPSPDAVKLVEDGLDDKSPVVREAAARSLGEMHSTASIPKLQAAVDDKDFGVSLAATAALVEMKNDAGYDADFELLTGARKSGEPLTQQASRTLHDRDKLVMLSIEQGMGFAPFGGFAVAAFEALKKNSTAPVRAAAALALAHDPDERSAKALVIATGDKDWIVRVAAIRAIGMRDDAALVRELKAPLEDNHDAVQYAAAASIIRLSPANAPATKH